MKFSVENGCFSYDKNKQILSDINFEVNEGTVLSVLGPNGAGKTTMLKCIMGLLKWTNGSSFIDGVSIAEMPFKTKWSIIGYVPQAKASYSFTAEEMVVFGRNVRINAFRMPGQKDYEAAAEIMRSVGIYHLKDRDCSTLSGGELQMVLIARALAAEPKVIILDEPESNLDFKNQGLVLDIIKKLAARGLICIFNTHYPNHALKISDKALLLGGDGQSFFGDTNEIITKQNIRKTFGVDVLINHVTYKDKEYPYVISVD